MLTLYFHRRYIIYLDLVLIIFASIGLLSVANSKISPKRVFNKLIILFVLGISAAIMFKTAIELKPLITQQELLGISTLNNNLEKDARILLTDSYYAPWFKGWVDRDIIAPGMFDTDYLTFKQWELIWYGDPREKQNVLEELTRPTYIHIGKRTLGLSAFPNECFDDLSVPEMTLYKFSCK